MGSVLFQIEEEMISTLDSSYTELLAESSSGEEWTRKFKTALDKAANKLGYKVNKWRQVWYSGDGGGEWLWDLVWIDSGPDWENFHVTLACEMELSPRKGKDDLLFDFAKLTVAVADFRLFIFRQVGGDIEENFKWLTNVCRGSQGFRYLAVCVPNEALESLPHRAWTL
jgi:hypothetical protein